MTCHLCRGYPAPAAIQDRDNTGTNTYWICLRCAADRPLYMLHPATLELLAKET